MSAAPPGERGRAGAASLARRNLASVYLAVGLLYTTIFVVPPEISPIFVDRLHESHAQAGLLMTIYAAAYALLSFPAGVLADRVGAHRLLIGGLALAGLAALALPLETSFGYLLAMRALTGVAAALVYSPGIALVRRSVADEHAHRAIGCFMAALTVGIATVYFLVPHLDAWIGWRWTFRTFAIACLGGVGALAVLRPYSPASEVDWRALRAGAGALVRERSVLAVSLSLALSLFVLYGVLTWMPPFLGDVSGFGASKIGDVSLVVALSQIPAALSGGAASARLGRPLAVVAVGLVLAGVICAVGLVSAHDVVPIAAIAVASAFGGTVAVTVLFALPGVSTDASLGAAAIGVATTIGMAGAIGATYLGGVVVGAWSYEAWFALLAIVALAAILALGLIAAARSAAPERSVLAPDVDRATLSSAGT